MDESEREWLEVRAYLQEHRFRLGVEAAEEFGGHLKVFGTPLVARAEWVPAWPVPLQDVQLRLIDGRRSVPTSRELGAVLPAGDENYSDAFGRLAAPRVFQNRSTYRLVDVEKGACLLTFCDGSYFDSLDAGEASGHAFAAERLGRDAGGIRRAVGDPCDPQRRGMNLAVSALTVRYDPEHDSAEFFLHWRDPAKVGHAGGLYQVVPSGVFQASGDGAWNRAADFSLVRFLAREYAEELGGRDEEYDNAEQGIDYDAWPFARDFAAALDGGGARAWCLGIGVDPLTFATDLLAVVVFDAAVFDGLFGRVVADNDEGRVLAGRPFTEAEVRRFVEGEPMQAAGAAILAGAWRHREVLLPHLP
ncbi:XRE family transcriptional regulator [Dactylosporangium salmoneum]|uniref:Transcriptional regulator n=1 Tax=Dactylosporangium salmoneum TaxID=53361 RepID=A0ABN3HYI5_9ACTN